VADHDPIVDASKLFIMPQNPFIMHQNKFLIPQNLFLMPQNSFFDSKLKPIYGRLTIYGFYHPKGQRIYLQRQRMCAEER
jgi:hypothetical protein